jgi:hypothetical protein
VKDFSVKNDIIENKDVTKGGRSREGHIYMNIYQSV